MYLCHFIIYISCDSKNCTRRINIPLPQQAFRIHEIISVEKEQLIESVRMYPCISNLNLKAYKDTGKKDKMGVNLLGIRYNYGFNCLKFI